MARETVITLVDDIDGSDAAETVTFGLDGWAYEVDLSDVHAKELRSALTGFVGVARRLGKIQTGGVVAARRAPARNAAGREQTRAIRDWANANGFSMAERGRIPAEVVEAFNQAH